jgi:uncharacterized membrane protein
VNQKTLPKLLGLYLRWTLFIAGLCILTGGIYYLILHSNEKTDFSIFQSTFKGVHLEEIIMGSHETSLQIIEWGVLLLTLIPTFSMLICAALFFYEKKWLYFSLSLVVFAILLMSLILVPHLLS